MATADSLNGVCGVVQCGDKSLIICHTMEGLDTNQDGSLTQEGDFLIMRVRDDLRGQPYLDTFIHEFSHGRFPDLREKVVLKFGKHLSMALYLPEVMKRAGFS